MKNYLQIDPGGASYFYGSHLISGCVPRFTVKLTVDVDGEILRKAVNDMLQRFPQMAVGIARTEHLYALKAIEQPCPVFQYDGSVRTFGDPELNDYLFIVSYSADTMYFDFLHVLGDGTGFIIFVKSIVYRYLELGGYPIENDGSIRTLDRPYRPEEGECGISRVIDHPASCPDWYKPSAVFNVPNISTDDDPADTIVQIRIPFKQLHGVAKRYQSSPVTLLSPLFSQAIYEKYESSIGDRHIVASIPVNLRPYFPSETTRYHIAVASLVHGKLFLQQSFENMLLTQKKLLAEQTKPELLAFWAQRQAKGMNYLFQQPTSIEEKVVIMNKSIRSSLTAFTYIMTNMGNIMLPETMQQYITEFYPILPTAISPFTIAATTWKNELILSVTQRDSSIDVCRRFVEILTMLKIDAYIARNYTMHTTRYLPL